MALVGLRLFNIKGGKLNYLYFLLFYFTNVLGYYY